MNSIGIETTMGEKLARYLDLATDQAKLTAANMANIDTPGYQTLGMDFEAEMKQPWTRPPRENRAARWMCARWTA